MQAFKFRLQKVLDFRLRLEDEARLALGRIVSEVNAIEKRIADNALLKSSAAAERFAAGNSVNDIAYYSAYINRLEVETAQLLEDKAAAEIRMDEAREAYLAASRERKILDKLKEKQYAAYKTEARSEENKTNDDIAAAKR